MNKVLAGGLGLLMLVTGHVHAGEILCPAVSEIHRKIESVEDVYFVDSPEEHEWTSESLVDVVKPQSLRFEGAEYTFHETAGDTSLSSATLTCKYGQINLKRVHPQLLEPGYSLWADSRCDSPSIRACRLMDAEYFNVSF
ncbi:DUF3757 domain-containing protein [Pseudomonas citrulli]|uniref:DUF3757 domain-containing protein n=1 Tax=Pseudomonas citrulli TaxID=3064347 RepID=A0ABT9BYR9_9PSED|nr:DUF3757 domain-containing protein [Pseudomonas sp. K18]MDO7896443.1 DUF3757 domain-containing protein [Pseudomonas sp. K18]